MSDLKIRYKNWRGETSERTIRPIRLYWGNTEWHPVSQWMMEAYDTEKQEVRDFALIDMQFSTDEVAALANAALEARAEAAALRDRLAVVEGEKEIWKSRAERYVHERNDALNLNSMRAQQLAAAWLAADAARAEVAALQSTPAQKEQSDV